MSFPNDPQLFATTTDEDELKDTPGLLDDEEAQPLGRNDDLYVTLNVPRDASETDIRERYRELAVLLHPDKASKEHRGTAEAQFRLINKAYEVLMDPRKRAAYDALGQDSLQRDWTVGQKLKSQEELRAEFARIAKAKSDAVANTLFLPVANNASCTLNLSEVFDSGKDVSDRLRGVFVGRTGLNSTYKTQISSKTSASIGVSLASWKTEVGALRSRRALVGTVKHQFSPRLRVYAITSLLSPGSLQLGTKYQLGRFTTAELQASSPLSVLAPVWKVQLERRLRFDAVGTLSLSGSPLRDVPSAFAVTYSKAASVPPSNLSPISPNAHSYTTEIALSPAGPALDVFYSVPITRALTVHTGGQFGFFRPILFTRVDIRLVRGLMFRWVTGFGGSGLSFEFSVAREGSKFVLPVVLAPPEVYYSPFLGLACGVLPVLACWVAEVQWWAPKRRLALHSRMAAEREEYAEIGLQRKKEAEEVVELLRTQMARRVEAERQIDGLIIVQASYYGVHQPQEAADVTIPLQALVRHSQLAIPGGRSKVGLVGFWDPCMGETNKVLEVDYIFRGRKHKVIVNDEAYLLIPLRGHAVL